MLFTKRMEWRRGPTLKNVWDASITAGETEADVLHDPASPVDQPVNAEEGLFVTITFYFVLYI